MKGGWSALGGLLIAAAAMAGAPAPAPPSQAAASGPQETDAARARPARRIVALAPHLTELVYAAGAGDRLVAVGRFSDFPPEARAKPVISDAFAVDYEALLQLHPDLVLVWTSGTPERTRTRLRTLGLPVVEFEIGSVDELAQALRKIGSLAGTEAVAQARARTLVDDWAALSARYGGRRPVRVFYQLWDAPLMTLGEQHLIASAIRACGGRNVFADLPTLTATVSWEAAVQRDPELVVGAAGPGEPAGPGRWAEFPQVSATRHRAFARIDGDLISRSGPRFVQGALELCQAIDRARQGLAPPSPAPSRAP